MTGWPGPSADLFKSPIFGFAGGSSSRPDLNPLAPIDNKAPINFLLKQLQGDFSRQFWLALVPGTSEVGGHHHAYEAQPGDRPFDVITPEFRSRIDHAHQLLRSNLVAAIILSGGAIDLAKPAYVEAERGLSYLLGAYASLWPPGELALRTIVEPWAIHSECNVRNADRLAALLGLDQILVVTTYRHYSMTDQGYYFEQHAWSSFDSTCRTHLGYVLGDFQGVGSRSDPVWDRNLPGVAFPTRALLHAGFPTAAILADPNWALGALESAPTV
jgi:hypothetical protein